MPNAEQVQWVVCVECAVLMLVRIPAGRLAGDFTIRCRPCADKVSFRKAS